MHKVIRRFAFVPGLLAALLPIGKCPACWPAYLGFLSALGLGFLAQGKYLLLTIILLLIIVLISLAWKAPSRQGYGPLLLGLLGSLTILLGKFQFDSKLGLYAGISTVMAATIWNTRKKPRLTRPTGNGNDNSLTCQHCQPDHTPKEGG